MDNKDFDKIFSEKLKETQEFEYMDSDWENVLGRIQPPEKKRRGGGWLWLLGLGFLFMAATSIYLATSLKQTNQHLVDLENSISKIEKEEITNEVVNTITLTDTVFQQIQIVQYDTVVKTIDKVVYRDRIVERESTQETNIQEKTQTISESSDLDSNTKQITIPKENDPQKANISTLGANAKNGLTTSSKASKTKTITNKAVGVGNLQNTKENLWLTSLRSSLFAWDANLKPIDKLLELPGLVKVNNKKKFSWKNFSVGIMIGTALPEKVENNESDRDGAFLDRQLGEGWNERTSFDVGLLLGYQVHPKFQITGAVNYQQINYKTNVTNLDELEQIRSDNSTIGALFSEDEEIFDPLNMENTNGNFLVKQRALEYRLGGNYLFRADKKWKPYLGLSVSALSIFNQELSAIDGSTNIYSTANKSVINTSKPENAGFRMNAVVPTAGFQWNLGKKISWNVEGYYNQRFKKRDDQLNNTFGIRTGISYRF